MKTVNNKSIRIQFAEKNFPDMTSIYHSCFQLIKKIAEINYSHIELFGASRE